MSLNSVLLEDTLSPQRYYATGSPVINGGLRTWTAGARTSTGVHTASTYRTLVTYGGALYAPYFATGDVRNGLNRVDTSTTNPAWPVSGTYSLCNIMTACSSVGAGSSRVVAPTNSVFETASRAWLGDASLG